MIIVDTSVWIDFFKNKKNRETEILLTLIGKNKRIGVNSIIIQEVLQGKINEKDYINAKEILNNFTLYEVKHKTIINAIAIYRACVKGKGNTLTGQTVSPFDCIIASSVIEYDLEIFSSDAHFEFISKITGKLKIYYEH